MDFRDYQIIICHKFKAINQMRNRPSVPIRPANFDQDLYEQIAQQGQSAFVETEYPTFKILSELVNRYQNEISPRGYPLSLKKTKLSITIDRTSLVKVESFDPQKFILFGGLVNLHSCFSISGGGVDEPITYLIELNFHQIKYWSEEEFEALINLMNDYLPPKDLTYGL